MYSEAKKGGLRARHTGHASDCSVCAPLGTVEVGDGEESAEASARPTVQPSPSEDECTCLRDGTWTVLDFIKTESVSVVSVSLRSFTREVPIAASRPSSLLCFLEEKEVLGPSPILRQGS